MTRVERHLSLRVLRPARLGTIAALSASLLLGACSASTDLLPSIAMKPDSATKTADATPSSPQNELQKATNYWGYEYTKKPTEIRPALNYAKNLKALGEKQKALAVLQQVSLLHGSDQEVAGEYGRLALELDQVGVANQMLTMADDPTKPDWRIVSARGTVMAKQGKYTEAIPFYERALTLSPNNPTVTNNLAMAYAMNGDAKKAEDLLRQAVSAPGATPKVRENLALVLGLQGRYDESKSVATSVLNTDSASANAAYLKQMVKLEPTTAMPDAQSFAVNTSVSPSPPAEKAYQSATATGAPLPVTQGVWQTSTDEALPIAR
ncbi:tetratricopeptide repeat protein [Hyphomicrobium sp.]|uniref:tetratricopeptide repeat protein n=1 Tax=Hyphomicrobium sp. TaxID=82 RepID=UPI000F95D5D5|nr:tetratricopeptide repeat protein [Hyphomicrobium sp.]RUP09381.1 MAG: tetratricopeptide repeat protein [Hyphomicrobium sp.]